MNILFWYAIALLTFNVILLTLLLLKYFLSTSYIIVVPSERLSEERTITPNELREIAARSWRSAHPNASAHEQSRAMWNIEKEAHKLERLNRQQNPFA